ncbi:conserved hypothetical protein [Theileria orientalis strain Shintoku]|uniref:Uncharacterized protein n=1 Tax=Theileria orientalis strain Shintoku TaxID=869250 RepID=J4C8S3_THEOR|nr:conserved hypothetical protein [Theileria orientalis strain Shintoku]BAM41288.1 conserved hypothetical protein [Theileria orientalis strain Shintoku]|eukprot:XP_009691589.1 conserved hypothetical protein [Theileria orientalis strain Shintoku]
MFRNVTKNINRKHVIGCFAISGTLYFGYKNVTLYLDQKSKSEELSQQFKANKTDTLSDNLRKFDTNFDKKDLALRNGDLMFIKYNLERLNLYNRYKMILVRNLSNNRIYDDLGIVYNSGDMYYIVLMPSVKLRSKIAVRELNITDRKSRGVVAIEYDDLIRENHPDVISLRRLICSESTRDGLVKSLKSAIFELKSSVNSGLASILSSWLFNLPYLGHNKSEFINALTYRDELDYTRSSIKYSSARALKKVEGAMDLNTSVAQKSGDDSKDDGTGYSIESLGNLERTLGEYEKDIDSLNALIEKFTEKIRKSKFRDESKYIGTETSLVTKVYSKSGILPLNNSTKLFSIYNYFELDSLYNNAASEDPEKYSRLSSPFSVYTGGVNRVRLKNLKYPQIRDILYRKL